MGWGNSMPLAQMKREAASRAKAERRAEEAEAKLALVQRLVDRNRVAVPSNYLGYALGPPNRCPGCVSAYVDCPVHS